MGNSYSCPRCGGKGKIYFGRLGRTGRYSKGRGVKCKLCDGNGYIYKKLEGKDG